ncbi:hypothetical protein B0H21DRAFT_753223 [Amylocystis lapponica]|nr:hypothetical protein B0H21DRAFT_753223 [Amylocystis lapponica]
MFYTTSSSIEAASFARQFPNEIVEKVLTYAWNDPANDRRSPPYRHFKRWKLLATASGTCRQWHAVMHRVCMLNVIIETNLDLRLYKSLQVRTAGQSKDSRHHETLSLDPVRARYLCINSGLPRGYAQGGARYFEDLFALGQHCRAAELHLSSMDAYYWPLPFDFLRRLTQLTTLHMVHVPGNIDNCLPVIHVPSVTYLRVNHFPTYAGPPSALPASRERLLGWNVIACFPRLRTLCLDEPTFLKALIPAPRTLTTIVIEAPPLPSGHATIHGWNVAAALNRGLTVSRIVVNTGANEPLGWTQAAAAAAAHGVILERRCTY